MRIALVLILLCLTACMATPEPATSTTGQAREKQANTEMRDAIQAPIEKARQVEVQVLEGAEKQKADIEAAGG